MAKSPKMIVCRVCGNPIAAKAKTCPHCGAKNKKPFYKRWWFILLVIIAVIGVIGSVGGGGGNKSEKFAWKDIKLSSVLPEPRSHMGRIIINSDKSLSMYVSKTSEKDYQEYLDKCRDKGFTVESESIGSSYSAYNEDGYKLSLWYAESSKEISIDLNAPEDMDTLQWPESELVSLLPVPESDVGKISSESSDRFFVLVGKTSLEDYRSYVDACSAKGFSVDYEKGEKYYHADNSEGFHLSLQYQGNNVMSIEIERPEEPPKETEEAEAPDTSEDSSADQQEEEPGTTELVDGMRPEFKEAMDSYEAFYDEYCDVMNRFAKNPSDLTLLTKYADVMDRLSDMDEQFEAWEDSDMSDAEMKYYLEVQGRVMSKLLTVSG